MLNKHEVWVLIEEIVVDTEILIYDIELPKGINSFLKIYIVKKNQAKNAGIGHEECVYVTKRVLDHSRVEEILPGNSQIEVSSPGINRKLTRPEHFVDAIGERIKVILKSQTLSSSLSISSTLESTVTESSFEKEILPVDSNDESTLSEDDDTAENEYLDEDEDFNEENTHQKVYFGILKSLEGESFEESIITLEKEPDKKSGSKRKKSVKNKKQNRNIESDENLKKSSLEEPSSRIMVFNMSEVDKVKVEFKFN